MQHQINTEHINYCVLIPTYNNAQTLRGVISATLEYTSAIIVVNDGSTDLTESILLSFKDDIDIISYPKNRGKGAALKKGFKRAEELGYEYAITLDSDGQHFPSEIPKFLEKVQPGKDVLVIGNRDMNGTGIPSKSIFGRKFSNFWVKLETGLDLMDTQSGYRLYTVARLNQMRLFTDKYDFELESLVRWAWRDYPIEIVTVKVHYPPPEERVSHFKGFQDNLRLTLLNSFLVMTAFIYMFPKRLLKNYLR